MNPETLVIFFISYILFIIKPGPGQAFRVACALEKGFLPAMTVRLAISTICTVYFLVIALSYNGLITYFETFAPVFKILGGAYLIYLGVTSLLKHNQAISPSTQASPSGEGLVKFFIIGIVLSLSNPMDIVYFMSVLPNLVPLGELSTTGIIQGASIVFFTGIIIDMLILSLVVLSKESINDTPLTRYINIVAGVAFILIGAFFIFSVFFIDNYTLELL